MTAALHNKPMPIDTLLGLIKKKRKYYGAVKESLEKQIYGTMD